MSARVLVVEDNPALVANLTEILEDQGYSVRRAGTLSSALEQGRDWVDVALVDLKLPDGDGLELSRQLKEISPDCEVILLTGYGSVESAAAAVRAGAYAYLLKPCATPELLRTLAHALKHVQSHAEKRALARRAQTAEKLAAVGTLTAGLSHEIRNPLNAASLQLAVVERRVKKLEASLQPPLLEPLTLVRDELRRLDHILQDFLQFARPTSVDARPLDVCGLLKRVTDLLSPDAAARGLTLALRAPEVALVSGDEGPLRQVFMNLCLNALDASPQSGLVQVLVELSGDAALVHVDDAGAGVPDEARERIFEPFFTTKPSGSGLGLPISHAIVSQHGGAISIERSPLGGARFSVRLPRA